jgi:phosphoserine phosphatase
MTATNSFVARPIVDAFGIKNMLATEPKIVKGKYVNAIEGTPCFQEGKVTRLQEWLKKENLNLDGSYFYSDSHNDCPLMEKVTNAIAVDPDEQLEKIAKQKGWKIISLLG